MKTMMKKLSALLMAAIMVLAMSATAFAAETVTIVINGAGADATFEYVQVIAADPTTATGWTFINGAEDDYMNAFGVDEEQMAIAMLIKAADEDAKLPEKLSGANIASTAQIAKALSSVAATAEFTRMENPQTVDKAGIYAIKANETGFTYTTMAAYVGFGVTEEGNYPSLECEPLTAKKIPTTITKNVEDLDHAVQVGDIVTYTIETAVPYIEGSAARTFRIKDQIQGAEYYLSGEGAISSVTMEGSQDQVGTIDVNENGNEFEVVLDDLVADSSNPNANKKVTVQYTAKITALQAENTPYGHISGEEHDGERVDVYTGSIMLTKYNEDKTEELAGAGFEVTKDDGKEALTFVQNTEGHYTYDPDGTITEVFTGPDGTLVVKGLGTGEYHFTETTAPDGYSINELGADATLEVTEEDGKASGIFTDITEITDTKLSSLPSTGGIGTTIFTIGGCVIMIVAAGLYFTYRRKAK